MKSKKRAYFLLLVIILISGGINLLAFLPALCRPQIKGLRHIISGAAARLKISNRDDKS